MNRPEIRDMDNEAQFPARDQRVRLLCAIAAVLLAAAGLIPAAVINNPWRKTASMSLMEWMHGDVYRLKAAIAAIACLALAYIAFRFALDTRHNPVPITLSALALGALTIYWLMPPLYVNPADSYLGEPISVPVNNVPSTAIPRSILLTNELTPPKILLVPPGSATQLDRHTGSAQDQTNPAAAPTNPNQPPNRFQ
jgi:hypothetical protein